MVFSGCIFSYRLSVKSYRLSVISKQPPSLRASSCRGRLRSELRRAGAAFAKAAADKSTDKSAHKMAGQALTRIFEMGFSVASLWREAV